MKRIFNAPDKKAFRKKLRNESTSAEAVLWKRLRQRRTGFKFRRQESIGPYIVDFYCPQYRLIVELDGAVHNGIAANAKDYRRTKYLEALGLQVMRFENRVVFQNPEGVMREIGKTIRIRTAFPIEAKSSGSEY